MRARPEDTIRYNRQYYVLNRARVQQRRRLKKALEAEDLSKKERARLEAELASTYNSDWTPPPEPSTNPAAKPAAAAATLPTEPAELLAAPRRKWRLLEGNVYFTSDKGYTAEEIKLIQTAAKAARKHKLATYRPCGRTPLNRLQPSRVQANKDRWRANADNAAKERLKSSRHARAQGRAERPAVLAVEPVTLGPRTLWKKHGNLVFLNQRHAYTLPQIQELATSLT